MADKGGADIPDILYHSTTQARLDRYTEKGAVRLPGQRQVILSADEGQAWREAHRTCAPHPRVLVVDTARNRRQRLHVRRGRRPHLFVASSVPMRHVLNLQDNYAQQISAGGIPVRENPDGTVSLALIQVKRRSGVTWEVAKGKLERGETPEQAAVREVREEMGVDIDFAIRAPVGQIRYGFMAPGRLPRLKTVHLYLLDPLSDMGDAFDPATGEGIGEVRWFSVDDAVRAVTHTSLRPLIRRVRRMLSGR